MTIRLAELMPNFLEFSEEERLAKIREIRADRLVAKHPEKKERKRRVAASKASPKRMTRMKSLIENMTPEDKAKLLAEMESMNAD